MCSDWEQLRFLRPCRVSLNEGGSVLSKAPLQSLGLSLHVWCAIPSP